MKKSVQKSSVASMRPIGTSVVKVDESRLMGTEKAEPV
jgi:hypothetical protein